MMKSNRSIIVYGTTWCPDCKRSKQFFGDQRVHYIWVDIEKDPEAMAYVVELNKGKRIVPTIVFPNGDVLVEPSNAQLAEKLGITAKATRTYYDVIIIGAGPAGLTTSIYTSREGLDTLIIEKGAPGGQIGVSQIIDNFPGFDEGITGVDFAARLTRQAKRFDVEILQAQAVTEIRLNGIYREVITTDGSCYATRALLIATGAHYKVLGVPGEDELIGINIHFCATCDGAFYKDQPIMVIGGGNSAYEESLYLARYAEHVTILARNPGLNVSKILQEKIATQEKISVVAGQFVEKFQLEDGRLKSVITKESSTGKTYEWTPGGVFVFIGMSPNSDFLPREIDLDKNGFILSSTDLQTSMNGVFTAGDVRAGATAQAASAAGEGATAALMIRHYLQTLTGIK